MSSTNDHDSSNNTINETEDDFVVVNSQQTAVSTLTQIVVYPNGRQQLNLPKNVLYLHPSCQHHQ
jgi:hypothetical protein